MPRDQTSAVLSFCLPGLGQLYQRRLPLTFVIFGIFCVLAAAGVTRYFLPLWALAAGWEALQAGIPPGEEAAEPRRRRLVFAGVGIAGFVFWFLMLAGVALPVGTQMQANAAAERIASAVRQCRAAGARWPATLLDCPPAAALAQAPALSDPYGHAFQYQRTDFGFELRSAGRDGRFGTADDFQYHFR